MRLYSWILVVLALLTMSGCAPYRQVGGGPYRSSGDALALGVGVLAGAAIVASLERPYPPVPETAPAPQVIYVVTGPIVRPTPLPASPRDRVPTADALPRFDPIAARTQLSAVDVTSCTAPGAPRYGHAVVTFNPDGIASKVVIDEPRDLPPETVECVGNLIGAVKVTPFRGSLVTVGTVFRR